MFAFFDIDGTLLAASLERTLLRYLITRGQLRGRPILRALMRRIRNGRFHWSAWKSIYLAGIVRTELESMLPTWWETRVRPALHRDILEGLHFLRTKGLEPVLVSGTLEVLAEYTAARLGGARVIASQLETDRGSYTGMLHDDPVTGAQKWRRIRELLTATGTDPATTWGFGNRWSDVHFLGRIGFPVVVNPDRRLRRYARKMGWPILHPGHGPIPWHQLFEAYLARLARKDHDQ